MEGKNAIVVSGGVLFALAVEVCADNWRPAEADANIAVLSIEADLFEDLVPVWAAVPDPGVLEAIGGRFCVHDVDLFLGGGLRGVELIEEALRSETLGRAPCSSFGTLVRMVTGGGALGARVT